MQQGRSKLYTYLNHRVTVVVKGERSVVGTLLAFDGHMNVVLADAEETRVVVKDKVRMEEKRTLGLTVVRGDVVTTMSGDKIAKEGKPKRTREETDKEHVTERAPKKVLK